MKPDLRTLPVGLSIATGIALIILLWLGTWQVQRLQWKQGRLAEMARTRALPPVSAESLLGQGTDVSWRAVTLTRGRIYPAQLVYMHGVADGVAGYHVLSHCAAGKDDVLVELGFGPEKRPVTEAILSGPLNGRLRPFEKPNGFVPPNAPDRADWYSRDPQALSQVWHTRLRADYFIQLQSSPLTGLKTVDVAANLPNRHLEYALTWYGLAAALIGVYIAVLSSRRRAV
ncbi:MAG: SURF1 family protein [Asticcacaulis sp.]